MKFPIGYAITVAAKKFTLKVCLKVYILPATLRQDEIVTDNRIVLTLMELVLYVNKQDFLKIAKINIQLEKCVIQYCKK